jgi:hypothetical protein
MLNCVVYNRLTLLRIIKHNELKDQLGQAAVPSGKLIIVKTLPFGISTKHLRSRPFFVPSVIPDTKLWTRHTSSRKCYYKQTSVHKCNKTHCFARSCTIMNCNIFKSTSTQQAKRGFAKSVCFFTFSWPTFITYCGMPLKAEISESERPSIARQRLGNQVSCIIV